MEAVRPDVPRAKFCKVPTCRLTVGDPCPGDDNGAERGLFGPPGQLNASTADNPDGYHRLIGGSVEFGETHRDAVLREVRELGAAVEGLRFIATVENIFYIDEVLGHEVVFLYSGGLNPVPVDVGATLTEEDGKVVPVVWRSVDDAEEAMPLYPARARDWVGAAVAQRRS